ncbi:xylulokinase [Selenomonas ruminantium]|uniref:Xylulokinase n=1 Tax=Selenomonas ruminantium TaxID=971 RepID=A0A1M6UKY9_SELRU|nr:FGGY family carbohydrate kinase [Selenomonas ruminantium]SHK69904.1 xylulokinase [Selenomonas ruminantium]
MKAVLVLNMGMKSIRSIIFGEDGRKIAQAALPLTSAINEKCVEQDASEWWEKAVAVMQKSIHDARITHLAAITVTSSASCLVCLDKDGKPLLPVMMVSDKRAQEEAENISKMPGFVEVREQTRLEMSSSLLLPKILWIKNHAEKVFRKTVYFLSPNAYLLYRLCGRPVTDVLDASKFHYYQDTRKYPEKLLQALGIELNALPQVVDIGSKIGVLSEPLSKRLVLSRRADVVVSSYDAICSFFGSGAVEEGEASDVSGTVTVFRTMSYRNNTIGQNAKVYENLYEPEGARIVGGSNNLGGGLIEWAKQCYYQNEAYPYEVMEKEAAESEIGANGLIFLPYLLGERAPIWNDEARGVFFGLERMHTRKDMTRAVFESTGFIDMDMKSAIEDTGIEVKRIRFSGGLARLNLIAQIKADILGLDVLVLSEFETTSTGAAMLALIGLGHFQNVREAANDFVKVRMIIKPDMDNHRKYRYIYNLYKSTYEVLKPQYKKRIQMLEAIRNNREVKIENL